jgi:hypothetical protein
VVDLSSSSNEGDLITDISQDEEFTRRLFGDLNHDVLEPPDDDKIIVLSDSNEEEEDVHEEKTTDTEDAVTSAAVNPTSTASIDADDSSTGVKTIIVMITPPIRRLMAAMVAEMTPGCLRLPHQEGALGRRASGGNFNDSALLSFLLSYAEKVG